MCPTARTASPDLAAHPCARGSAPTYRATSGQSFHCHAYMYSLHTQLLLAVGVTPPTLRKVRGSNYPTEASEGNPVHVGIPSAVDLVQFNGGLQGIFIVDGNCDDGRGGLVVAAEADTGDDPRVRVALFSLKHL